MDVVIQLALRDAWVCWNLTSKKWVQSLTCFALGTLCCKPGSSPSFLFGSNASLIFHDLPQHLCADFPNAVSKPDTPLNVSCSNSPRRPHLPLLWFPHGGLRVPAEESKPKAPFLGPQSCGLCISLFRRRALNRTFCQAQLVQNSGDHQDAWVPGRGAIQASLWNWGHFWVCTHLSPPDDSPWEQPMRAALNILAAQASGQEDQAWGQEGPCPPLGHCLTCNTAATRLFWGPSMCPQRYSCLWGQEPAQLNMREKAVRIGLRARPCGDTWLEPAISGQDWTAKAAFPKGACR